MSDVAHVLVYENAFASPPVFVADMQTSNDGDTANLRWQNKDIGAVDVWVDEEQSADIETFHPAETVGYLVIDSPVPAAELYEDFESYVSGEQPLDWMDTAAGNSLEENDALFEVLDLGGEKVFGTASTATNIHSHYVGAALEDLSHYEYSGRMMITNSSGGVGVTFFSQYPLEDAYYRLRRYSGKPAFHIAPHGTGISGDIDTGVVSEENTWYQFRIQVEDAGAQTEIRAKVWADGEGEPAEWQVQAYDATSSRLISGTVGLWSMYRGEKYWDELSVTRP